MPKQKVILIVGVVLGLLAVFMTKVYMDQQSQAAKDQAKKDLARMQAQQAAVLVAKKDIPKGTTINETMLETKIFPEKYVQPQAVTSLDRIAGMITIAPISKDEQITLSKLSYSRAGGLAEVTPIGKRAITISIDNISALAGMIKAGDYVDVLAMLPESVQGPEGKQSVQLTAISLFQNVLILAVGQETSAMVKASRSRKEEATERKETSPLITLALDPKEANLIAYVQEVGKIRLVLRSPADSNVGAMQPANWNTLLEYLASKAPVKQTEQAEIKPAGYVEIYRGAKKEEVPIYK